MSAHLMIVAGYMDLPSSHKLVLMKVADSADDRSRLGFPGLDTARLWAGLKKSRALEVMKDLQEWGLIMQVEAGHRGRRAVFKVFPEPGDEAFSLAVKKKQPCPGADKFAGSPGIPGEDVIAERIEGMDATRGSMSGSGAAAPAPGKGPASRTQSEGSERTDPNGERVRSAARKGPIQPPEGSDLSDPFGTHLRNNQLQEPPLPPADAGGGEGDDLLVLADATETADATEAVPTFEDFYAVYPRKGSRKDAEKAWRQVTRDTDPHVILAGARRFADDPNLPEPPYIKLAPSWLRAGCWDDPPQPPRASSRRGTWVDPGDRDYGSEFARAMG